jgi:hypothetical protein
MIRLTGIDPLTSLLYGFEPLTDPRETAAKFRLRYEVLLAPQPSSASLKPAIPLIPPMSGHDPHSQLRADQSNHIPAQA